MTPAHSHVVRWACESQRLLTYPQTIADGLQAQLGSLTWPIVQRLVDDVVVVSEEEILEAMRLIVRHLKVRHRRRVHPAAARGVCRSSSSPSLLCGCKGPRDLQRRGSC